MAVASGAVRAIAENGAPQTTPSATPLPPAANDAASGSDADSQAPLAAPSQTSTIAVLPTATTDESPEALPQTPEPLAAPTSRPAARRIRPIGEVTVEAAAPAGLMPTAQQDQQQAVVAAPSVDDSRRLDGWSMSNVRWAATNMRHRPLYFEQVNAERYGYTVGHCVQPLISGAHFFLVVPALPYKMAVAPQATCQYTLGHYRPGNCVPRRIHWPQCGDDGAGVAAEAATAVALVFLIP